MESEVGVPRPLMYPPAPGAYEPPSEYPGTAPPMASGGGPPGLRSVVCSIFGSTKPFLT